MIDILDKNDDSQSAQINALRAQVKDMETAHNAKVKHLEYLYAEQVRRQNATDELVRKLSKQIGELQIKVAAPASIPQPLKRSS